VKNPTDIQQQVLRFILSRWDAGGALPSSREIMSQFGWSSPKAATDVIDSLKRKGLLASNSDSSRKYQLTALAIGLPILGEIPAGFPVDGQQMQEEPFALTPASFGLRDRATAFLLRVRGDSMIGRRIFDGDLVLIDNSREPRHLEIIAALIDNESTLKTLIREDGKAWLRSENPAYPRLIPFRDLQVQGVARWVIRPLMKS
jgi:repressor LexA